MQHILGRICVAILLTRMVGAALAIESLGYQVLDEYEHFEVRLYDAHLLATVEVDGDFEKAGNSAFRDLFDYIQGDNATNEKIAMTAPVIQEPTEPGWKVSFVMPGSFDPATLPAPADATVSVNEEAALRMAAITYSGNWSRKRYLKHETLLQQHLDEAGLEACGTPRFARHNPPFWPSFLRKNEILMPLCEIGE